jgi:hypothetical protein
VHVILKTEYGDANLDGFVDAADLATARRHIGGSLTGPNWEKSDFNGDGRVDAVDLAIVRRNLGFERQATAPAAIQLLAAFAAEPLVSVADADTESTAECTVSPVTDPVLNPEFDGLLDLLAQARTGRKRRISLLG